MNRLSAMWLKAASAPCFTNREAASARTATGKAKKSRNIVDSIRPDDSRKGKNAIGNKGLEVVNSLDNAGVERGAGFGLALLEVGEVDGGSAGGADGTPRFKKRRTEFIPVVTIDASTFK